jgi:hypothetical protein
MALHTRHNRAANGAHHQLPTHYQCLCGARQGCLTNQHPQTREQDQDRKQRDDFAYILLESTLRIRSA